MSNVLDLPSLTTQADMPARPHFKLLRLSRALSLLFTALMGLSLFWVAAAFVIIFFYSNHILVGSAGANVAFPGLPHEEPGMIRFSSQPTITHAAGFLDIVIATSPIVLVCWHLRELFSLYASGVVFARENAAHLKRVGLWLVVWPISKFVANMLFQFFGGTDRAWVQMIFFDALILGLIVLAIAQVMQFGHEIEQEKDSFV